MHIEGDIKIWSDGHKVCARLHADGPEGPIVIQASAPIGPVRRKVARMFARQGVSVSGSDPAFAAKVQQEARRKALKRLQRMAPGAFRKGGLAPYLAKQELLRRKKRRRALANAGRPVGAKPVGRLPNAKARPHLHKWRERLPASALRFPPGATPRALMPMTPKKPLALSARPALLARAPFVRVPQLLSPRATGGGGGASAPNPNASARDDESAEDAPEDQSPSSNEEDNAQDDDGSDADSADEGEGAEEGAQPDDADEEGEAGDDKEGPTVEGVSGYGTRRRPSRYDRQRQLEARRTLAVNRLRAAMRLLLAAYHDPQARQRIADIAAMAGEGHPAAKKSFAALAVAHKLHKKAQARGTTKALATSSKSYGKALPGLKANPQKRALVKVAKQRIAPPAIPKALAAPSPPFAPGTPADAVRWWDILAAWRRGMG